MNFDPTLPIRLIGDVHGDRAAYNKIAKPNTNTIQVGDFGHGFANSEKEDATMIGIANRGNHYFIRGNHDNLSACKQELRWIPDGHVYENMMFIGGARSIDQWNRTEGFDWWADEELNQSEFYQMIDIYEANKPEIMITHDAPTVIASRLWKYNPLKDIPSITNQALDSMFAIHKPKKWYFGHHHRRWSATLDGCDFRCININETVILGK